MKSSIFLAATSAMLAMAGPVEKRAMETEVVVEYYTVTVTGERPAPTPSNIKVRPHGHTHNHSPVHETKPTPVVTVTATPEQEKPKPTKQAPPPTEHAPTKGGNSGNSGHSDKAIDDKNFQDQSVFHHNIHRANHSAPEVGWDHTLAQWADNTANTCTFKHDMDQGTGGYGQNIALWGGTSGAKNLGFAGAIKMAATNMWYNGEFNSFLPSFYGQPTPDMNNFEAWGHMSQMVWASSTKIGCAAVFCPRGTAYDDMDAWFSVCNYHPPGNMGGSYGQNIHPPKGDRTVMA
ncbi:PR-1-like protein [Poronia punctata]|nr:PR-1-like protein [Poronia punctata]